MKRLAILLVLLAFLPAAAHAQPFSAELDGASVVPGPGDADGFGFAFLSTFGTTLHHSVFHSSIGTPTAAHIHIGAAGVSGPILLTLDIESLLNGTVPITAEVADQIEADPSGFYVDLHNAQFPDGAIRGQIGVPEPVTYVSILPIVGKVAGQGGTNFVTDLRIVNNYAVSSTMTLDYFASNPAGLSAPTATRELTVAPGESKALDDVVGATFGIASGYGALKITSDLPVIITARVLNDRRAQGLGTAGFATRAVDQTRTIGNLTFLANNDDFRTNIGYFNPGPTTVSATFFAQRSDGEVFGTNTIDIPPNAMVQQPVFSLISSVPAGERTQDDFYVTWSASGPILVYGSVTDHKTGDAVFTQ